MSQAGLLEFLDLEPLPEIDNLAHQLGNLFIVPSSDCLMCTF